MKKLKELGVPVFTGMKVIRLDKNKDGRVIGVTALEITSSAKKIPANQLRSRPKTVYPAFGGFWLTWVIELP